MRLRCLLGIVLSLGMLMMFGCGGGGGGVIPTSTVSGTASKGPINGGTVQIFAIQNGVQAAASLTTIPATVTTAADGSYSASIGYTGPALVVITGGSYVDEATGATVPLATPLRAALTNAAGTVTASVTPFTEVAVQKAVSLGGLSAANMNEATSSVSALIGIPNILETSTADPTYALALATVSQMQVDTASDLATVLSSLSNGLDVATDTITVPAVNAALDTASANVLVNAHVNSEIKPAQVALAASPATGATNNDVPVTITATVTYASGAAALDGTVVNFAVTSGTGNLSQASAATAGGAASVVLNSTAAGSVTVSASTSTSASATVNATFISQPTLAIVKLATSGPLPTGTSIGALQSSLNFATNKGLSITADNVVASGGGAGSMLQPNITAGQVVMGLINATGIQTGVFAVATFGIAPGNIPTQADFSIAAGAPVFDLNGDQIPGVSIVIDEVVIQ